MHQKILDEIIKPVYGVIVTTLALVTGLLGSLYSSEIRGTISIPIKIYNFTPSSIVFWILFIIVTVLFYYRHAAKYAEEKKKDELLTKEGENLKELITNLEVLIRTMPPKSFLEKYTKLYQGAHRALQNVRTLNKISTLTKDAAEESIRFVLNGIASLAQVYNTKPQGVLYAANIMIYKKIEQLTPDELVNIKDKVLFKTHGSDIRQYLGVLEYQKALSYATDSKGYDPDKSATGFYLPVPHDDENGSLKYYQYLPGAPRAFKEKKMNVTSNSRDLADWCRRKGNFKATLNDEVEEYFLTEKAKRIKSFISIPVIEFGEIEPVAVLNIHCDEIDIFKGKEKETQFTPLIIPLTTILHDILKIREDLV